MFINAKGLAARFSPRGWPWGLYSCAPAGVPAMKSRGGRLLTAIGALLIASAALFAHHGSAAYDMTKLVTVQGTVTGYEFVQPHVLIHLDVKGDNGNTEKWLGESNTPNIVARSGWSRNSLKPGDQITMVGYRAKNGARDLRLEKVILPNGQELNSHWGGVY
jgi:hypothetical protein